VVIYVIVLLVVVVPIVLRAVRPAVGVPAVDASGRVEDDAADSSGNEEARR
jgi:hypothetical protein